MSGEDELSRIDFERKRRSLRTLIATAETEPARQYYRMLLEELERDAAQSGSGAADPE